jgi:AmmeMemoRadiSam system protein B
VTGVGLALREPAVAGSFYPAEPGRLGNVVASLLAAAAEPGPLPRPLGVLVPHAGLAYSGRLAAAGWRSLLRDAGPSPTVVILGTNHTAWIDGVAVFDSGAWRTPAGDVTVDGDTAREILALGPPFAPDRRAHRDEHSIEVQLPILAAIRPGARIVPCSVAAGTGAAAVSAGERLGDLLNAIRARGAEVLLAISTDMAHYPAHRDAVRMTERLVPAITSLDACATAAVECAEARSGAVGMACGMCGIQPSVLGLAALRAMGATGGSVLGAATSADAGAGPDRTVGYLAVAFG